MPPDTRNSIALTLKRLAILMAVVALGVGCSGGGTASPNASSSSSTTRSGEASKLSTDDTCDEYFRILGDLSLNDSEMSVQLGFLANQTAEPGLVEALNVMSEQYKEAALSQQYGGEYEEPISTVAVAAFC